MTLRRRWFIARDRFHMWMWGGGPIRKAIIKRLPMHFSDPHYVNAADFDRRLGNTRAVTLGSLIPRTYATGQTFHFSCTWPGGSSKPIVYIDGVRQD